MYVSVVQSQPKLPDPASTGRKNLREVYRDLSSMSCNVSSNNDSPVQYHLGRGDVSFCQFKLSRSHEQTGRLGSGVWLSVSRCHVHQAHVLGIDREEKKITEGGTRTDYKNHIDQGQRNERRRVLIVGSLSLLRATLTFRGVHVWGFDVCIPSNPKVSLDFSCQHDQTGGQIRKLLHCV